MRALTSLACLLLMAGAAAGPAAARQKWYRGNTHTHTTNSDGDSTPFAVASWYKSNGYDFLFITDHDRLTPVERLNAALGAGGGFLVIGGVEVTDTWQGFPVHVNALNPRVATPPQNGGSVQETLQRDVNLIRAVGGLPYVAHPRWHNAVTAENLKLLTGSVLFEVYNGGVNHNGDVSGMWDEVLSAGKVLYGIAADDTHSLTDPSRATPGRAWVMVRADALTPDAIVAALARGDFYATNGVRLGDLRVTNAGITITTEASQICETPEACTPRNPRVEFIGQHGRVLKTTSENPAEYRFANDELYVRARVVDPSGRTAWTQPVFLSGTAAAQAVLNAAVPDRNAARGQAVAPGTVAVMLGAGFANVSTQERTQPGGALELDGTRVTVAGRPAPLFFVSPTQVNFLVPPDTPTGAAEVVITNAQGSQSRLSLAVQAVAPALFTQDGTGAGEAVTYKLFRELPNFFGGDGPRHVIVFATGVGRAPVTATANGQPATVEGVYPNPTMPGLTQIHMALPAQLAPGPVTVVIRVGGAESNAVTVRL